MKENAQVAYEAYGDEVVWLSYQGDNMPDWTDLPEKIKNAWRAAATAVLEVQQP